MATRVTSRSYPDSGGSGEVGGIHSPKGEGRPDRPTTPTVTSYPCSPNPTHPLHVDSTSVRPPGRPCTIPNPDADEDPG